MRRYATKSSLIIHERHYGVKVWTNELMDALRREECLCLNCDKMMECEIARALYVMCQDDNLALAMTRCKHWKSKEV
jgi:hypothetical protein